VLQRVAACCSVLRRVAVHAHTNPDAQTHQSCVCIFKRVAECCSVLQCVAICCSVLQCVAANAHTHLEAPTHQQCSVEHYMCLPPGTVIDGEGEKEIEKSPEYICMYGYSDLDSQFQSL